MIVVSKTIDSITAVFSISLMRANGSATSSAGFQAADLRLEQM